MSRRPKTSGVSVKVSTLSDDELIGMLEERGVEVGPVGDTTRNVYQKKLQKLLDSGVRPIKTTSKPAPTRSAPSRQSPPSRGYKKPELNEDDDDDDYVNESHHGDDDDDVEPDDDVENYDDDDNRYGVRRFSPFSSGNTGKADTYRSREMHVRHTYRNDSPRTQQMDAPTSSLYNRERNRRSDHGEESSANRTEYSRSYETRYTSGDLSRSPLARPSHQGQDVRRSPDKKPRSWCPLWVQFLILLIFSAAVFVLVQYVGWSPANLKMLGETVEPKENGKASQ